MLIRLQKNKKGNVMRKVILTLCWTLVSFFLASGLYPQAVFAGADEDFTAGMDLMFKERKFEEGFALVLKAAEAKNKNAMTMVSIAYLDGLEFMDGDIEKAKYWMPKAAAAGDAEAQFHLASMYANGRGFDKDLKLAASWMQRATNHGHVKATYTLGTMYISGDGVESDFSAAFRLLEKAAKNNCPAAKASLGMFFASGIVVSKDAIKAVELYRDAAEAGDHNGQLQLAGMLNSGEGAVQNTVEAMKWLLISAHFGNQSAAKNIPTLANAMSDDEKSEAEMAANSWLRNFDFQQGRLC